MSTPIVEIVKKNQQPFGWNDEAEKGFNMLKRQIIEHLVLSLPDFNKPFQVETNANNDAIGVVVNQEDEPITYYCEMLNEVRRK